MKATEDNVSMKEIGLIVEVNFRFYASETLRMCSLSRGFYLLNSKTWPFLHINSSIWLRHSVSCTWREYWFLEVGGVFRTVRTVVRTEELYAIRLHKTLLKMTVVCYYCRNYFIFISILRAPSRDPGFSLFRGRDSGFLREGGARLVKWNWMGHGIWWLFTCNARFEIPCLEPRTGSRSEPFFLHGPTKKLFMVWRNKLSTILSGGDNDRHTSPIQLPARLTVVSPTSWVVSHAC